MTNAIVGFVILGLLACDALAIRPPMLYSSGKLRRQLLERNAQLKGESDVKEMFVSQRVDNFGWASDATYQEKVVYSDKYWVKGGPILLYAGNEGEIELFTKSAGYLWDLEQPLQALVVFAEHRYYGKSMPFGNMSYSSREHLAYFTADQAMADYAMLIKWIKANWENAKDSKVIVFGGSYGGMLASWMRMKYPDVFDGAISSSAPIWSFTWPCDSFARVATQDFVKYGSENCRHNIRKSWDVMNDMGKTEEGRLKLTQIFDVCQTLDNVTPLKNYVDSAFSYAAMINYPYPADFLTPLPAWPVRVMCEQGLNDDLRDEPETLLAAIAKAVNIYYGAKSCINVTNTEDDSGLDDHGWTFQTCTEMTIPFCATGETDMFEPQTWSDQEWSDECAKMFFGIRPNPVWTEVSYWGKNIESASNILFSNGLLDPWSAGGVMKPLSPSLPIVIIPDGAHHLELRAANTLDTPACKAARETETAWIRRWLAQTPSRQATDAGHA